MNVIRDRRHELTPAGFCPPDPSSAGVAAPPALRPGAEPHSLVGSDPVAVLPVSLFVGYIERRRSPLDPVLRSLVSARIAQLCHCEFCIDITSMILAARSGSQDKLLAVADWRSSTLFSEKERLALAYAEAATQTPPALDDALRSAMAAHFDARALTELTALIGLQNLSARFNAAMAIPAQGLCQIPTSSSQNKE